MRISDWSSDVCSSDLIGTDDTVTIRVPTPEIGNGAMKQVAMNVADELQCDGSRVRVESGSILRNLIETGVYSSGFLLHFGGHATHRYSMTLGLQRDDSTRELSTAVRKTAVKGQ